MRVPRVVLVPLLALLMVASAPAHAVIGPEAPPPTTEALVEGHTVYALVGYADPDAPASPPAVTPSPWDTSTPPPRANATGRRDPGVLWFNDQYLVEPRVQAASFVTESHAAAVAVLVADLRTGREACGGAVLMVNRGDPDPRAALEPRDATTGLRPPHGGYAGSYLLTDPNGHPWVIDRYDARTRAEAHGILVTYAFPVWVVNVGGGPVFTPDAGVGSCPAGRDAPSAGYAEPGRHGACYGGGHATCPERRYNALLYAPLDALLIEAMPRSHAANATDVAGCEVGTASGCPGGDDDAEGNSHAHHPLAGAPHAHPTACPASHAGRNPANHGRAWDGSCDFEHPVRHVDLYHQPDWRPATPPQRTFVPLDTTGAAAPFHDHHLAYGTA